MDFRNTIIIMTSNIGSHIINERFDGLNDKEMAADKRDGIIEATKNELMDLLKQTIRPEFLNRIDEIIMFLPLTLNDVRQIVSLQIGSLTKMLAQSGIELAVSDKAVEWLAQDGFDPQFGARPIKRSLQRNLVNELSKQILGGKVNKEKPVLVDASDMGLTFSN